ncbi:DNA cytosine methyltransferase [Abyssibacter profundi]|uniref:Cytosine-specific methyltransferase n=1 Tax=Abyssibacter profundi TaxID=2182787 RepID=A0A363UMH8_9GAMM|nr:DNA cytosine methyltransferase [Abyssibacter profundi]PWN56627.1 DNA (cytosine-5-)-methyltransferase [Abyssibacter profundi]
MTTTRPLAIDLFAGAGGLSLGFEQAGFDLLAAVEVDPVHASVHKYNFPDCAVFPRSVEKISGAELLRLAGDRSIDVIVGGAPCQGFSLIGQRALDDPRNSLVKEFIRIVSEVRPRYFVFENVKGLTLGKHRRFLEEIVETLQGEGYSVRRPWKVLNARDYSVPQNRERLFLIGCLDGEPPEYPNPHESLVSCEEALGDLPDAESFAELESQDYVAYEHATNLSEYARHMRCLGRNGWDFGYRRSWNPSLLTSSLRTSHTEISRRRFGETLEGKVEPISRFFKLPSDGQSNTLRAGTDSARGAFTSPRPIHYAYDRCVTVREMARLHGFPDWFRFHATKWHGARQIGNAVPPPLAKEIAAQIIGAMGVSPARPKRTLKLGDPDLLEMDMSQASKFWGIEVPIGKRNRKSGAKKRSQLEVEHSLSLADG